MDSEFPVVLRFQHPVIQVSLSSDIAITSLSLNFVLYIWSDELMRTLVGYVMQAYFPLWYRSIYLSPMR